MLLHGSLQRWGESVVIPSDYLPPHLQERSSAALSSYAIASWNPGAVPCAIVLFTFSNVLPRYLCAPGSKLITAPPLTGHLLKSVWSCDTPNVPLNSVCISAPFPALLPWLSTSRPPPNFERVTCSRSAFFSRSGSSFPRFSARFSIP